MREVNPRAELMAVVKADGYGHGAVPSARAALAGGAGFLGVATPQEAIELRAAGIDAPVLAWLWPAGEDIATGAGGRRGGGDLQPRSPERRARGRDGRASAADPREDRHRPWPQRGRAAGPGCRARRRRRRGPVRPGRRRGLDEPPGQRRRPRRPVRRRADPGLPGGARPGGEQGHPGPLASPGEHACGDRPPRHLLRPGPVRHRPVRAQPGEHAGGAAAGDDAPRDRGLDQAGARGLRGLVRPDVPDDVGDHLGAGAARLRRRDSARRQLGGRGVAARPAPADRRAGGDGPGRRRLRRRPGRGGRRRRRVRPWGCRRTDGRRLGRGMRHHRLRDRHQDRSAGAPPVRRRWSWQHRRHCGHCRRRQK